MTEDNDINFKLSVFSLICGIVYIFIFVMKGINSQHHGAEFVIPILFVAPMFSYTQVDSINVYLRDNKFFINENDFQAVVGGAFKIYALLAIIIVILEIFSPRSWQIIFG